MGAPSIGVARIPRASARRKTCGRAPARSTFFLSGAGTALASLISPPLSRFLNAVMNNTPVDIHQELRLRKQGEPEGGMPPLDEEVAPEETDLSAL
jgi:hypothetical protein